MSIAATVLLAFAVNFFWLTGLKRGLVYGALITGSFLAFWGSGLWIGASRHAWGLLSPVVIGLVAAGWLVAYLAFRVINYFKNRNI